ncbi:MAG TPA: DUF3857 domain-containing protein [Terracidiphilus sp.]|nr:DUF3857 domain-containing protein [Terracidiphilus sp.]
MTSDPLAPDAPAVYLYREISDDESYYTSSAYARIKVLTEEGKQLGAVEVPYDPETDGEPIVEGRTIHSDGTVIPLRGNPAQLLEKKLGPFKSHIAFFHMPSVEVGSILEYRWTVPHASAGLSSEHTGGSRIAGTPSGNQATTISITAFPAWDVQLSFFIHKEHFFFNRLPRVDPDFLLAQMIAKSTLYAQRLPAGARVVDWHNGKYSLDIADVPAFHAEPEAPPDQCLAYRVEFYAARYFSQEAFWSETGKQWSQSIDKSAESNSEMKNTVGSVTASASTPEQKARLLYAQVQAMRNTDFLHANSPGSDTSGAPKAASETWKDKSGSANDLALLYLSLARVAGLDARAAAVVDRRRRLFNSNYLSMSQFNDFIVVLRIDSKEIYLDPGQKLCPFGVLAWQHTSSGVYVESAASSSFTPANSPRDAITAHAADLAVDASGSVSGTVQLVMNGPAALHWRQLNLTADSDEVKKQVIESLQRLLPSGLNPEIAAIKGLDTPEGFLQVTAKVSGALGSVTGKRVLLPAFLFSSPGERTFVSEDKREAPVDLHYAEQVMDEVTYHLPAGYTVEGAPQSAQLPWPDHAALVVKVTSTPNTIDLKHIFARAFVLLDAKEYPALHDYYGKLAANDQQQVVLGAPSASGN